MPPELYTEKMVKVFNFTLGIFCHNKKKTRKHDRLFKIQEIEKQLVFSLDVFRNEIEIETFSSRLERTQPEPFSPKSFFRN